MSFLKEVGQNLTVNCLQVVEGNWKTELGGKPDREHSSCLKADRGTRPMATVCTEVKVGWSLFSNKSNVHIGFSPECLTALSAGTDWARIQEVSVLVGQGSALESLQLCLLGQLPLSLCFATQCVIQRCFSGVLISSFTALTYLIPEGDHKKQKGIMF